MSTKTTAEAQRVSRFEWERALLGRLAPQVLLTALVLATFVNHKTGRAFPSVKTIAAGCGRSDRSVQRHLRVLRDGGYLAVAGGGKRTPTHYVLTLPLEARNETTPAAASSKSPSGGAPEPPRSPADDAVAERARPVFHAILDRHPPVIQDALQEDWAAFANQDGLRRLIVEALDRGHDVHDLAARVGGEFPDGTHNRFAVIWTRLKDILRAT